jgi:hypothetical protein
VLVFFIPFFAKKVFNSCRCRLESAKQSGALLLYIANGSRNQLVYARLPDTYDFSWTGMGTLLKVDHVMRVQVDNALLNQNVIVVEFKKF